MIVKSKKGKKYNPIRNIRFSNTVIRLLSDELSSTYEDDYKEFLQKEIMRHQNLVKLCKNKIYLLTTKTK
jgi:hypothetical protein